MNAVMVAEMTQKDRVEWELLTITLDAHPQEVLHDPASPPWISRDVYAHLARWIDYSNQDMESYCAGGSVSLSIEDVEDLNSRWQREDSWMTFTEARERAHEAFVRRLRIVQSIPIEKWDTELERIACLDGAEHFALHRSYILAAR